MKTDAKRLSTIERRKYILHTLQTAGQAITGAQLSEVTNVSRQIIVKDISFLKAQGEAIIATSQGYIYLPATSIQPIFEKIIVCHHSPEQTELELMILVNNGITVKDIIIEHPIYGDLSGTLMLSSPEDVYEFIKKIKTIKASYLSQLTDGIHLHTLRSTNEQSLAKAIQQLKEANILVSEK